MKFTDEEQVLLLGLAREAIRNALKKMSPPKLISPPASFTEMQSSFVTLHNSDGSLRGCIGNIEPFETLLESVPHNARNAAFHDPRFPPVASLEELQEIAIEVSVLTPPEIISSIDDFIVGKHGIIMRRHNRGSVFLPQVPTEQEWDRDETLTHLSIKAGLDADAWKDDDCVFRVFESSYFSE
ncbi:MAG: AmmeMemoRadiSam system protein A [Victivallales bacterium]|nr:AmmeMemoRadiSam system protein A [Victivallales bacterium]